MSSGCIVNGDLRHPFRAVHECPVGRILSYFEERSHAFNRKLRFNGDGTKLQHEGSTVSNEKLQLRAPRGKYRIRPNGNGVPVFERPGPLQRQRDIEYPAVNFYTKYAFRTYCSNIRCVLKKDPFNAMAWRMISTQSCRSW